MLYRSIKSFALLALIIAALINAVACQDVTFRTRETDEPATTAFAERSGVNETPDEETIAPGGYTS
jgi:hypothetical protein